jgi:hypothetical protein
MLHNFKTGYINFCQICNSKKISEILDLGFQPLADDLREEKNLNEKLTSYPIKIYFCKKCMILQNNYIVGDITLYPKNYHYRPGISKDVVMNMRDMAIFLKKKYNLNKNSLVVDIGSNDGSLLKQFKDIGIKKLVGVEPTNTIKFQKKLKIFSIQKYFNKKTSRIISKKFGKADLVLMTNVFAHSNKMGDIILGIKDLLKDNGTFILENHYLLDVIKKLQFDTFYHEHLRTYSLNSLNILMKYYNLNIIFAKTTDRYGGNIQAHFSKKNTKNKLDIISIKKILLNERKFGLNKITTYEIFKRKIDEAGSKLNKFLGKNKKNIIIAKSFPARASVILHYFSFLKKYIKYIAEQPTSLKLDKYVAGTNIKIISDKNLKKMNPKIIIVLAWHLFYSIHKKWIKNGLKKTKFIKPLPKFEIH